MILLESGQLRLVANVDLVEWLRSQYGQRGSKARPHPFVTVPKDVGNDYTRCFVTQISLQEHGGALGVTYC